MGRHSAPDDTSADEHLDTGTSLDLGPAEVATAVRGGRHASPAQDSEDSGAAPPPVGAEHTQMIAVVDAAIIDPVEAHDLHETIVLEPVVERVVVPLDPAETVPPGDGTDPTAAKAQRKAARAQQKADRKAARGESDVQADLRMLRDDGALRVRCLAGVLIAFAAYTVVMFSIGQTHVYLFWIWIPIVVSGILVGALLDLAHRASD